MRKKVFIPLIITSLFALCSCSEKNVEEQDKFVSTDDCDCKGKVSAVLKDSPAQITQERRLRLRETTANSVVYNILTLCDTIKIGGLSSSKVGEYDYVISGNLRPPCVTNGVAYFWSIDVASIRKK